MASFDKRQALRDAKTIAIIGISDKMNRTSNAIAHYLLEVGYDIIPINPQLEGQVLGRDVYASIKDVPSHIKIDIVDIFRNKQYSAEMVKEIAEWCKATGQHPVVWTQLDVSSPEAEAIAEEYDLPYVKNQCIMIAHRAYV